MSSYQKPNLPLGNEPDTEETARRLREAAEQIRPEPSFVAGLERRLAASYPVTETHSMFTMKKIAPVLLWVLAALVMIVAIDWAIRSIAPQPVPAAGKTPVSTSQVPAPMVDETTPVPSSKSYDWRGTTLTLAAALPNGPAEAGIYAAQIEKHATLEQAIAVAQRFGINGQAYKTPGEQPGTTDYVITDGKQTLGMRSAGYYSYTADVIKSYNNFSAVQSPQADGIIGAFLQSHGSATQYRVEWSAWRSAYLVHPVTAEGTTLRYEHYSPPMLLVTLDENGSVAGVQANILDVSSQPVGQFGILTSEQAFQKLLDPNTANGMIESMNGVPAPMKQWRRTYPADKTITIYGNVSSLTATQADQTAFIQIDGFPVVGQVAGLDQYTQPTYVQATGHFIVENEIQKFSVESWKVASVNEDGLLGTLDRQNGRAVLKTQDGAHYVLPDVPADVSMPFENAYVIGTREADVFQWKTIDNRMEGQGGGGGGGGGGSGFFKLNLTGTAVPFPTATQAANGTDGSGGAANQYVVQAGDTLSGIAANFGTSVGALMQFNGIKDPSQLMVGQKLAIPGVETRKLEGLRGVLSITINKHQDGSQQVTYGFLANANSDPGGYMVLEGDGLEALQKYNSRPVDIWGTLEQQPGGMISTVKVDRFEIPFPDLKVQVLKGTQKLAEIAGQPATLFMAEDGTTYVQLLSDATTGSSLIGKEGDQVELECVAIPGETVDGKPALRMFGGALATNPKTGQPPDMQVTADKPTVLEVPSIGKPPEAPTATIEKVELIEFMSDPRYAASAPSTNSLYFQPAWRFSGHYSNGDEFEVLIQALKQEYLLPEIEAGVQPG